MHYFLLEDRVSQYYIKFILALSVNHRIENVMLVSQVNIEFSRDTLSKAFKTNIEFSACKPHWRQTVSCINFCSPAKLVVFKYTLY